MSLADFNIYYYLIYVIACIIAFMFSLKADLRGTLPHRKIDRIPIIILLIAFCSVVGARSSEVGTDTYMYLHTFDNYSDLADNRDPFINLLVGFLKNITNPQGFLVFFALLYMGNILLFIENRIGNHNKFLLFFFMISLFFFKSMGINIIRQGVSLMFFLNAVNFYEQKKWKLMYFFIIGSILFHTTAIIAVLLFIASIFIAQRPKIFNIALAFFIICATLSFLGFNFFALLPSSIGVDALDARSIYYEGDDFGYNVGFKPAFFLFNLMFLIVGLFIRSYCRKNSWLTEYKNINFYLTFFLLASGIFFIAFQIPFSDRWGLFSWIFIPLFFEPLFKVKGLRFATLTVLFSICIFIIFEFINQ